jgi:hypothetical protein
MEAVLYTRAFQDTAMTLNLNIMGNIIHLAAVLLLLLSLAGSLTFTYASECLPAYTTTYSSLGCYSQGSTPTLSGLHIIVVEGAQACAGMCGLAGYSFSGVQPLLEQAGLAQAT